MKKQQFLANTEVSCNGCRVWTGLTYPFGYGRVRVGRKYRVAHRISWEISKGPIPPGLYVLHRCDNPSCINPKHLFLGTKADNVLDMVQKGRQGRVPGERNGNCRLSEKALKQACSLRRQEQTLERLSRKFHISQGQLSRIFRGLSRGAL